MLEEKGSPADLCDGSEYRVILHTCVGEHIPINWNPEFGGTLTRQFVSTNLNGEDEKPDWTVGPPEFRTA